jgi:carboxypeptidase family protein
MAAHHLGATLLTVVLVVPAAREIGVPVRVGFAAAGGIEGQVRGLDGQPIPRALVTITPEGGGSSVYATSGGDGAYHVETLREETYRIDVEVPGFDLTRHHHVHVRSDEPARVNTSLMMSSICECISSGIATTASISGEVVDEFGRPLPHARLTAAFQSWIETAYADHAGRFVVGTPAEGALQLTASDSGFEVVTAAISAGTVAALKLKLRYRDARGLPATERLDRGCRCGNLFRHEGR